MWNKFKRENQLLNDQYRSVVKERDDVQAKMLLLEQIAIENRLKDAEETEFYKEQINELQEKLERKEYFMQHKEKKWLEIEKILSIYCEHDEELKDKLTELKYRVVGDKKITNVVEEN